MTAGFSIEMIAVWGLSGLGVYFLLDRFIRLVMPRPQRKFYRGPTAVPQPAASSRPDSAEQLRDVMAATFTAKKVMSLSEYNVFKAAEEEVRALRGGHRVFSQTSLGEVIQSEDRRAHSAINSKRVDVLIISPTGLPAVAVEYQGGGHYQSDAAARDAVKKEALRKAGVEYIEIFDHHTSDATRLLIREALARQETRTPGQRRAS